MLAIQTNRVSPDYTGLKVVDLPRPKAQKGEVIIRVHCSPVNPSDLMMLEGTYIVSKNTPFIPGLVGVGTVVENHAGLLGSFLNSRRVVFTPSQESNGTWSQFAISTPRLCVPISNKLSDEDSVNLLSNAATAIGLVDTIKKSKCSTAIVTAAAGEVGRMLNSIAPKYGITLINIVRSQVQIDILRNMGSSYVLDMTNDDFVEQLRDLAHRLNARFAIDCIAGKMPSIFMNTMPKQSKIVIIGRLSGMPISFDGLEQLVGRQHIVSGFSINEWFLQKSIFGQLIAGMKAQKLLLEGHKTQVQHALSLSTAADKLSELTKNSTKGKILIYPNTLDN